MTFLVIFCLSLLSEIQYLHYTFFNQFVLCHPSNNTTSRNIGETDAWAVPDLKFLRGTVP